MLFHERSPILSGKLCQPLWSKKPRQPSPKPNLWVPLNRILLALMGFRFAGANIPLPYFRRVAQILGSLWSQWWVKSVQCGFTAKLNSGETSNTNTNTNTQETNTNSQIQIQKVYNVATLLSMKWLNSGESPATPSGHLCIHLGQSKSHFARFLFFHQITFFLVLPRAFPSSSKRGRIKQALHKENFF